MRTTVFTAALIATALATVACGSSVPPPSEPLAATQGDVKTAETLNAGADPDASTYLKHATDQVAEAKKLMEAGDNERATEVLKRAKADAELSIQLAKEAALKAQAAQVGAGK